MKPKPHLTDYVSIPFKREGAFKEGNKETASRGMQVSIPFKREGAFKGHSQWHSQSSAAV